MVAAAGRAVVGPAADAAGATAVLFAGSAVRPAWVAVKVAAFVV